MLQDEDKKDDKKIELLLNYLITMRNSSNSWMIRKEIAAWAAVVLYLAALFTIFNIVKKEDDNVFLLLMFVAVSAVSILFVLFIFKQYTSLSYQHAEVNILTKWIFKIINGEALDLSVSEDEFMPAILKTAINTRNDQLQEPKNVKKLLIPFKIIWDRLFKKNHYTKTFQINASIILDIVIIITVFFLVYLLLKIDWEIIFELIL